MTKISSIINIPSRRLSKLFKEEMHITIADYINELRQYAVRLADGGSLVVMATGNEAMAKPLDETLLPVGNSAIEKGFIFSIIFGDFVSYFSFITSFNIYIEITRFHLFF